MIDASHYTPQYQLDQMRELSPAVDTYLAQELFKEDFGAYDYTISDIVNNCYEIIIDELIDLGIKFSVTRSELLQDYFTAYNLITLKKVIDKRYLKVWLNGISQEKLELLEFGKSRKSFFVRVEGDEKDKIEEAFENVTYIDAGIENEIGFVTRPMSEDEFKAASEKLENIITRIRIEE